MSYVGWKICRWALSQLHRTQDFRKRAGVRRSGSFFLTTPVCIILQDRFIVYFTACVSVQINTGSFFWIYSFSFFFFFNPYTGFCHSRRTSDHSKNPTCGSRSSGGARPNPEVLRASEKECAWEGETTARAEQVGQREEIGTIFKVEEPRSHAASWVSDNSEPL